MSFFSHISNILKKIVSSVSHIFSEANIDKAVAVAKPIADLIVFAAPYVEKIALATPSTLDDKLVSLAQTAGVRVEAIFDKSDPVERKGAVLTLVGSGIKDSIQGLLTEGGHGINIGPFHLTTPDDIHKIPGDLFDSAAQLAYTLFVKSRPAEMIE